MNDTLLNLIIYIFLFGLYFLLDKYILPLKMGKKLAKTKSELTKDISAELEELKSSLAKEQHIHQALFNKEFEIYQALWKQLATLIRKSADLISFELQNLQEDSISQEFRKTLTETHEVLNDNIPFFSTNVYEPAKKLLHLINKEMSSIGLAHSPESKDQKTKDFEEMKETVIKIHPYVKDVEIAIRERIYGKEEK